MRKTLLIVVASMTLFTACKSNPSKTEEQTTTTDSTVVATDSVATDTIVAK